MPSHCNPHLCSDRLRQLLLPCCRFRFTSNSTSNTMLSAWPALTPSAATEHDNELLLQSTQKLIHSTQKLIQSTHELLLQNTWIPEANTQHSEIQRSLAFANASTPASKVACQEAKRPRRWKSGKGTESKRPKKSGKGTRFHGRKPSSDSPMNSDTEAPVPTVVPSDDELPTPTEIPSDDEQAPAPAPSPGGSFYHCPSSLATEQTSHHASEQSATSVSC